MQLTKLLLISLLSMALSAGMSATTLDSDFKTPPESTKPWCYWYWFNGILSKEGITKDLESMANVGIKCAFIANIRDGKPEKDANCVVMFTPEWYDIVHHTFKEAHRVGVDLYMFNGPGWSQSGGPWIKPEQSMRRVAWNEFDTEGGTFNQNVRPEFEYGVQDIAVLAVPRKTFASLKGEITNQKGAKRIYFRSKEPITARSLEIKLNVKAKFKTTISGNLYVVEGAHPRKVISADVSLSQGKATFLFDQPETYSFPEVTAREFYWEFDPSSADLETDANQLTPQQLVTSATLSGKPRISQFAEKQMGRLLAGEEVSWEKYIFPETVEPDDASLLVKQNEILNLTDKLDAKGNLSCTLPRGSWTIIYFGMTSTGARCSPTAPGGEGLECDKLSIQHTGYHYDSMFSKLIEGMTPEEKAAFKGITIDSYEAGGQNWTDGFDADFKQINGYDPIKLLPIFTGRVIDSAKKSDQFLWDLRHTIADLIAKRYIGTLKAKAQNQGLNLWCENYGHFGFPSDYTTYGGYAQQIAGEFWVKPDENFERCRIASSTAHTYGRREVYAESFTSKYTPKSHPYQIKPYGDQAFAGGINHLVLHIYTHQPENKKPGFNPKWGTAFHRNTPWFNQSQGFVRYLQRCHYMLQQGNPVVNALVYTGDFAPQMMGPENPAPEDYDYDHIGSDAILNKLHVVDGQWVVYYEDQPNKIAARYPILALPQNIGYVRPQVLKRIDDLVQLGGKVVKGIPLSTATFSQFNIAPIVSKSTCQFKWKARELDNGGMIFFLSNFEKAGTFEVTLSITNKVPELFNPVTGEIQTMARYQNDGPGTRITLPVTSTSDSFFVVFRSPSKSASVVEASASPAELELFFNEQGQLAARSAKAGTYQVTLSDSSTRSCTFAKDAEQFSIQNAWKKTPQDKEGFSILFESTINHPASPSPSTRYILDLGEVEVMAKVTINGTTYDPLWSRPYRLDVTNAIKPGPNTLSILVTSTASSKPSLSETPKLQAIPTQLITK